MAPLNITLVEADLVVVEDFAIFTFCIRNGLWGLFFLALQISPWILKLAILFVKLVEYEAELLHPRGKHFPRVVRRILWVISISFLINFGLVFYLQDLIAVPSLRPECMLLRQHYGCPAPDPALFFQTTVTLLVVFSYFELRLSVARKAFLIILPALNALALWFNGLNTWLEIGLGVIVGIGMGYLWSAVIIAYIRRDPLKDLTPSVN